MDQSSDFRPDLALAAASQWQTKRRLMDAVRDARGDQFDWNAVADLVKTWIRIGALTAGRSATYALAPGAGSPLRFAVDDELIAAGLDGAVGRVALRCLSVDDAYVRLHVELGMNGTPLVLQFDRHGEAVAAYVVHDFASGYLGSASTQAAHRGVAKALGFRDDRQLLATLGSLIRQGLPVCQGWVRPAVHSKSA